MSTLHFARPLLLWAWLLAPLVAWLWRARDGGDTWRRHVDATLLPALLLTAPRARRWRVPLLAAGLWSLAVLALAGPGWRNVPTSVASSRAPLALAVDLSSAALVADVPPTRLAQSKAKLARVLAARNGAPVALVAYADDAYTVAPLTDDAANVALYLDALAPDVMPVDGQRVARALDWCVALLTRAGHSQGDILLLAGNAEPEARAAARRARDAGFAVNVLGVGSTQPVSFRTRDGELRSASFDEAALRALARDGGGRYERITADDADLRALGALDARGAKGQARGKALAWQDQGYLLLPLLMLLVLPAFRRGGAVALVTLLVVNMPQPSQAADLWQREDQRVASAMHEAEQAYRRGDYTDAARRYAALPGADAAYNRGNALARKGDYADAVAAYDRALALKPGMADAQANRRAVLAAMKRHPPGGKGQGDKGKSGKGQSGNGQGNAKQSPPPAPGNNPGNAKAPPPSAPPKTPSPTPDDAAKQQQADAAQREQMQRALQRAQASRANAPAKSPTKETAAQRERRLANEAWLRRVPDDPGSLLRAKFRLEYQRRQGARLEEP